EDGIRGRTVTGVQTCALPILLERLGLPYPRARVINHPALAPGAARGLRFPVVVKPNIGGSGAGVRRFETPEGLEQAAHTGALERSEERRGGKSVDAGA